MEDKVVIKDQTFEKLKPIKERFENKNNKFSAQGYYKDKKVKIYEVFDKNQGSLREFVSKHDQLSLYFPNLILYDEKYIVEEWLSGKTLRETISNNLIDSEYVNELKKIIKLMWSINYNEKTFDYIDYIYKRLNKTNSFDLSKIPIRINHNDLSLDNILVSSEGLKIIDNEFLGCSNGWVLNYKNSFLSEELINQDYISNEILNELWKIRKEWSLYR